MKVSLQWINQYTSLNKSPNDIAERLSTSLAEVESVAEYPDQYEGIFVGKIIALSPHPDSSNLQIVTVDIQTETLTIVCGAQNIAIGDYVPVATVGTTLQSVDHKHIGPLTTQKRDIRGVQSEGMLCSPRELGISDDHEGILILNDEPHVRIGEHLRVLLKADDVIFEIENKALTHRPDAFSHIGIARELATIYDSEMTISNQQHSEMKKSKGIISFDIQDQTLCRRYSGAVISDITVKPSPLWLQLRLQRLGIRPINNIVDITNYVMMDTGQPLHAFDRDSLVGESVIVRTATEGENIITLDGNKRILNTNMLVIADQNGPVALAGIMGGLSSEVQEKTKSIILESANFEHFNNRKTSRALGLQTEASIRFSKNQDPSLTLPALVQAITMIEELADGKAISIEDVYTQPRTPHQIKTTDSFLIERIGDPSLTNTKEIIHTLTRLGINVASARDTLTCTIPTYRPDLTTPEDLIEEIARFKGYDAITPTLPKRDLSPAQTNPHILWQRRLQNTLTQIGLTEVYNYSFVSQHWYDTCNLPNSLTIPLRNPISPDYAYLKSSLLPSLLGNINTNRKKYGDISLFELDTVFEPTTENPPVEVNMLGIGTYTQNGNVNAYMSTKGIVESIVDRLNIPHIIFQPIHSLPKNSTYAILHPNRMTIIKTKDTVIGCVGELHPEVSVRLGIQGMVGLAELRADLLYELTDTGTIYRPVSNHPPLTIDISCLLDSEISLDEVRHTLTQAGSELLVNTIPLNADMNTKRYGKNKKAVTFRLLFQSGQRTLAKKDITIDLENVKNVLTNNFEAIIND